MQRLPTRGCHLIIGSRPNSAGEFRRGQPPRLRGPLSGGSAGALAKLTGVLRASGNTEQLDSPVLVCVASIDDGDGDRDSNNSNSSGFCKPNLGSRRLRRDGGHLHAFYRIAMVAFVSTRAAGAAASAKPTFHSGTKVRLATVANFSEFAQSNSSKFARQVRFGRKRTLRAFERARYYRKATNWRASPSSKLAPIGKAICLLEAGRLAGIRAGRQVDDLASATANSRPVCLIMCATGKPLYCSLSLPLPLSLNPASHNRLNKRAAFNGQSQPCPTRPDPNRPAAEGRWCTNGAASGRQKQSAAIVGAAVVARNICVLAVSVSRSLRPSEAHSKAA